MIDFAASEDEEEKRLLAVNVSVPKELQQVSHSVLIENTDQNEKHRRRNSCI